MDQVGLSRRPNACQTAPLTPRPWSNTSGGPPDCSRRTWRRRSPASTSASCQSGRWDLTPASGRPSPLSGNGLGSDLLRQAFPLSMGMEVGQAVGSPCLLPLASRVGARGVRSVRGSARLLLEVQPSDLLGREAQVGGRQAAVELLEGTGADEGEGEEAGLVEHPGKGDLDGGAAKLAGEALGPAEALPVGGAVVDAHHARVVGVL